MTSTNHRAAAARTSALPPRSTALVLVEAGEAALAGQPEQTVRLHALVAAARKAQVLTVFLAPLSGAAWAAGLAPQPGEHEFVVRVADAAGPFGASTLGLLLRANNITGLVLAGNDAQLAVSCATRDAMARGFAAVSDSAALPGIAEAWLAEPPGERNWQPEVKHAALLRTLEARVAPEHTALVLIDMQNDFVAIQGAVGRREPMPLVERATARIPTLLAHARAAGCTIVHVNAEYGQHVRYVGSPYRFPSAHTREGAVWSVSATELADGHEFPSDEVEVCLPGSWGREPLDAVRALPGELQITKHRFSAFVDTPLEVLLRARGIRTLIFAGVTTNCCVESSVRDASMLDFYVVVAADGVGTKSSVEALHVASLEQMRTYFALVEPIERIGQALASHGTLETV